MSYVIRKISPPGLSARADEATAVALALAATRNEVVTGDYLEWSDPDARLGRGDDRWTNDPTKAKLFVSFVEAAECWKARSKLVPTRPDGKPNRPLTAYSVSIEVLPEK